ncbi:MAG: hypothetical protein OHK0046_43740 [Anaerolineae bacterium]
MMLYNSLSDVIHRLFRSFLPPWPSFLRHKNAADHQPERLLHRVLRVAEILAQVDDNEQLSDHIRTPNKNTRTRFHGKLGQNGKEHGL